MNHIQAGVLGCADSHTQYRRVDGRTQAVESPRSSTQPWLHQRYRRAIVLETISTHSLAHGHRAGFSCMAHQEVVFPHRCSKGRSSPSRRRGNQSIRAITTGLPRFVARIAMIHALNNPDNLLETPEHLSLLCVRMPHDRQPNLKGIFNKLLGVPGTEVRGRCGKRSE